MKYKLLVLDLDGTLTNQKKEVTEHTRRTLIEAQERGVKIARRQRQMCIRDRLYTFV